MRGLPSGTQLALTLALGLLTFSGRAGAQSDVPRVIELSADTVEMGELFELRVTVPVPPASMVYFPDTLPSTPTMESALPVRVAATSEADGGARLTLAYPMIAFAAGALPIPGFDILMTARDGATGSAEFPGGSARGDWSRAPRTSGADLVRIPRQPIWVAPFFTPADLARGVEPRPPRDVEGGDWSWPALSLLALCASVLIFTLASTLKGLLDRVSARLARNLPPSPGELRRRALAELDALLAANHHREGRVLDFFTGGSDIARRYVEGVEGSWAPSLTSAELMRHLRERYGEDAAAGLPRELALADVVKFGRLRPDAQAAEGHWHRIRAWIESSEGKPW